ncbi:hypothetical protein MBLNU459_g4365t1 [Dothideomycetes sp. NU459]
MLLNSTLHGACPSPFYDASLFPSVGGFIGGRLCAAEQILPGDPTCCLPCPATDWTYADNFKTYNTLAQWLNVVGCALISFMLISYLVLPLAKTRSHYLSICLIVALLFINLGFIIPLGAKPEQCYNEITPNDMYSSNACAWSGAFLVAGGLSGAVWIAIRALSMHLQICWDILPGRKFFYFSQAVGWGVPAALFTATITVTGVSFRFGGACHVNHDNSMALFWGWLLAFSAASVVLQLSTFGYCIRVYLKSLWANDQDVSTHSSNPNNEHLPSYTTSIRTQTARAIYRRVKSVLALQWRGILIVTICLVDVIFFAVVFVYLDDVENSLLHDFARAESWVLCLVSTGGDKDQCLSLGQKWLVPESTVAAVLVMLSLISIELFLLTFRWSLMTAWWDFFTQKFTKKHEFVSLDALAPRSYAGSEGPTRKYGADGAIFEMQRRPTHDGGYGYGYKADIKSMSPTVTSLGSPTTDPYSSPPPAAFGRTTPDYHASTNYFADSLPPPRPQQQQQQQQQQYHTAGGSSSNAPERTFSTSSRRSSRTKSHRLSTHSRLASMVDPARTMGWDPTSTYAQSGPRHGSQSPSSPHREDGFGSPGRAL